MHWKIVKPLQVGGALKQEKEKKKKKKNKKEK